ncbi:uncharacterized protein LOC111400396 [Olea europaea var. sylvestris]|uniref:uncharacterized protein LOC111400396 n=1 Tax=Olea europaea var. sylvestris TaxID=158386 RepID=UPI000C1CF1DD|nr:uncharacterized protein LOC111400396 [Olea europaea var. sylvestris]
MWSKLDRAMVNNDWVQVGFNNLANFLPSRCLFDRSSCIVSLFGLDKSKKNTLRFFNMWINHESFHEVVQNCRELEVRGTKQLTLCKKLQSLKVRLKKLNKKHFAHISKRADMATLALKETQVELHDDHLNVELQSNVARTRKKALGLCEGEMSFYFQKVKREHFKNSDKCTKFFHSMVKRNAKKNFIATVCEEMGGGGFVLSKEHGLALIWEISRQEIKYTLFSIGDDKSLSPDRYSSCFFEKSWGIIGREFYASGQRIL